MGNVMGTAMNEEIRKDILELCRQAAPYGAGIPVLKAALRKCGHDVADQELMMQVSYLEGKGLVRVEKIENRRLDIQRRIVFLTPEGTDYLEGNGPDITGVG
ncbi:MAG: hypothetical protein NC389_09765 [Acetatifactor muris]|nr:hypothetical protein [Acetatifactor muris]